MLFMCGNFFRLLSLCGKYPNNAVKGDVVIYLPDDHTKLEVTLNSDLLSCP